jgi:hypothetical protein
MTRLVPATLISLILTPFSGVLSDDETYVQLPKLEQIKVYFIEHQASLNTLFELYATDNRIDWLECNSEGFYRITSFAGEADFTPEPAQKQLLQETCVALNIRLVQRVDSGISVIWKDLKIGHTKFRIELYGADKSYQNSCLDHRFESPISSCMVSLDSRWSIRYIGIVDRES